MRNHLLLLGSCIIVFVLGCGQGSEPQAYISEGSTATVEMDVAEPMSPRTQDTSHAVARALSSTAVTQYDTARRFILTGDLRFRTRDVVRTTFGIEELIARQGGYVANTRLATHVDQRYLTPISTDSALETTKYTVVNRLTVRVPSNRLDSTLKALIAHVDFLDHRTLTATDVRIALLRDDLARRRLERHSQRLNEAIDEQGRKLAETVRAEEAVVDRRAQADEATLNTLEIEDRIAYSTLTLDIYQREVIRREMLANEQNIEAYEPGFFHKAGEALHDGWELLQDLALLLLRSWSLVFCVIVAYLLFRRLRRKAT